MVKLEPGDIGATRGRGILGYLHRNLFAPETDRFHHLLIWKPYKGGDWIILESISKGLSVGLLSWYKAQDIKFYRVDCPSELRRRAPLELIKWGRSRYDYLLIPKLVIGSILAWTKILWKEHRLRKLRAEDLCPFYSWDSRLLCTEAVWCGYNAVGVNIIPYGVPPLPSSFRQAELEGRLSKIE